MNRISRQLLSVLALAVGILAVQGNAATDLPLSWRGQPGSTYQEWLFNSNQNPAPADTSQGVASVSAILTPGKFSSGWVQQLEGAWDLGREGTIQIPLPSVCKYVSVQVDQLIDGAIYSTLAGVSLSGASVMGSTSKEVATNGAFGTWTAAQTRYQLDPSTPPAPLVITGAYYGSVVTRVVVETLPADVFTGGALTIRPLAGSKVEVSWPLVEGTVLQGTAVLGGEWADLDVTPVRGTDRFSVILDATERQFLRVRQP